MAEFVTAHECQRSRDSMYKDLGRIDCQVEKQMEESTDTKVILARLTIIQEIASKTTSDLVLTVKEIDKRILDREKAAVLEETRVRVEADRLQAIEETRKPKFWESEIGGKVILAGVGITVLIVLVALGQSVAPIIVKWFGG